jgi:hypothetical protein
MINKFEKFNIDKKRFFKENELIKSDNVIEEQALFIE